MPSMRRHLLVTLLCAFAAVWALSVGLTYLNVRDQVGARLDEQLARTAQVVWMWQSTAGVDAPGTDPYVARLLARFGVEQAFQVWDGTRLRMRSANAPEQRMASSYGASSGRLGTEPWRFYYRVDALRGVDVIVGSRLRERQAMILSLVLGTVWPLLFGLPLLALFIVVAVSRGLRPLDRLANELAGRRADALEPLADAGLPREVKPMTRALNGLLARLAAVLDRERQFTADASHELRTPLAALQIQAQRALRATSESDRRDALEGVAVGVQRAARLVDQLLTLARLDPDQAPADRETVDLHPVAAQALADADPAARARGVELTLQVESATATEVSGEPAALQVLIGNLVNNAIRHSAPGATVAVAIAAHGQRVELVVSDSGDGIPAAERERIFDRFYRGPGQVGEGSGLGLSIVARVAHGHGADVVLEDAVAGARPPGLRVRVRFPAAGSRPPVKADLRERG